MNLARWQYPAHCTGYDQCTAFTHAAIEIAAEAVPDNVDVTAGRAIPLPSMFGLTGVASARAL